MDVVTLGQAKVQGQRFFGRRFDTVAAALASTLPAMGTGTTWLAGAHTYLEAASGASDHHVTTAGGVKLYVQPVNGMVNLEAFGATGATADIKTMLDKAATAAKRIILPTGLTLATKVTLDADLIGMYGCVLNLTMVNGEAIELSAGRQMRGIRTTSPFTGPTSAADNTGATGYAYGARSIHLHDNCYVEGNTLEYASAGYLVDGAGIRGSGLTLRNIRQYQGWGAAIHVTGAGSIWNHFSDYTVTDCDRANETEAGASFNTFENFTHTRIGPVAYTGAPVDYADYTFIADVHSHTGEGACVGNVYRHGRLIDCKGGITAIRSNGSNDSDLPRNNTWDDIDIEGRVGTTGYESIYLQGHNNRARVRLKLGGGITSMMRASVATGNNCSVEITEAAAYALPLVTVSSTADGAEVGVERVSAPTTGSDFLVSVSGPNTLLDLDVRAVTGTTGYLSLASSATGTTSKRFRYSVASGETFAAVTAIAGTARVDLSGIQGVNNEAAVKDIAATGGIVGGRAVGTISRNAVATSVDLAAATSFFDTSRLDTTLGTINDAGVNSRIARQGPSSVGYVSTIQDPATAALIDNLSTATPITWPVANEGIGARVRVQRRSTLFRFRFKVVVSSGNYYANISNSAGVVLWKTRTSVPATGTRSIVLATPATVDAQVGEELLLSLAFDNTTVAIAGVSITTGDDQLLAGVRGTPHVIKLPSLYTANTPVGVQMTLSSNLAAFHPHITVVEA